MLERTLSSWRPGDVVGRASWNELAEPGMDDRIARRGSAGGLCVGICDGSKARDQRSGSKVHGGGFAIAMSASRDLCDAIKEALLYGKWKMSDGSNKKASVCREVKGVAEPKF